MVELLATGSSGGAQEHVANVIGRIDRSRYDVSVLSLSGGAGVRRIEKTGVPVCVLDDMPDEEAIDAVAAHLAAVEADVVHNHMYRAEVVGTQAAWKLATAGRRRPLVVGTVHSSRVRSDVDRDLVRRLTPRMDHLVAVSRAIVRKLEDEGRVGAPISLIYNGIDLARYEAPEVCCTLQREYDIAPGRRSWASWPGWSRRRAIRRCSRPGPACCLRAGRASHRWRGLTARGPRGPGAVARPPRPGPASHAASALPSPAPPQALSQRPSVTFTGRRDDVPAVTAALDVAVLPSYREAQGLSILEAMALARPVVASAVGGIPEMIEHARTGLLVPPRDPDFLAHAIVRLLTDHQYADLLGRAGRRSSRSASARSSWSGPSRPSTTRQSRTSDW